MDGTRLLIAAAAAWSGLAAGAMTFTSAPAPAPAVEPVRFDRWQEPLTKADRLETKKQDRLTLKTLAVEPVKLAMKVEPAAKIEEPKPKTERDEGICRKGKRWFKRHGRRSWRCRR